MAADGWTPLHAQIHRTLKQRPLLPPGQLLLLAVSGGQDSLCLAKLLLDLQPKWRWQLAIAHCDHRWREDSAANARHVQQLAATWQLPYYAHTATAPPPTEAAARDWRYESLLAIAQQIGATAIVTGHTASDRAETLLFNLVRGSGMDGLQALGWARALTPKIQLVRPLLAITRSQTAQFCQDLALPVWDDATNRDRHYRRNRLRLDVVPLLQTHFNPNVEAALAQAAEILQAEVAYLDTLTTQLYEQTVVIEPLNPERAIARIERTALRTAPLALQRRVCRRLLQQCLSSQPNFDHVEKLVCLLDAPNRTQTDPFPGGAIAQVERNWILVQPILNQTPGQPPPL